MSGDFALLLEDLEAAGLRLRRAWPRKPRQLSLDVESLELGQVAGQWYADPDAAARTARRTPGSRLEPRLVLQPAGADRVLSGLAPLLRCPGTQLVGHRPERRAVVRLAGDRYAKLVAEPKLGRLRHSCVRTERLPVRTPRLRPEGEVEGAVVTDGLPGIPLSDLLKGPRAGEAMVAVGAAVATLHATAPPAGSAVHGPADEVAVTRTWENRVREFGMSPRARVGAEWSGAESSGRSEVPSAPRRLGLIHRDLHDGQFVLADDGSGGFGPAGVGLLDFDLMAAGDPALDLANLIEHLHLRQRQGALRDAGSAVAALLEGYRPDAETLAHTTGYRTLAARRVKAVYAFRSPDLVT